MNKLFKTFATLSLLLSILAFTGKEDNLPNGWIRAGSAPKKYDMGVDTKVYKDGKSAAFLSSNVEETGGFGTLMQTCSAADYLGKRIKLTGYIKSENVEGWAGLWLRVDKNGGGSIRFDNMKDRSIKGSTEWTKCEIVLDVPKNSSTLNFGALLVGEGKIWFDGLKIETVKKSVPETSKPKEVKLKTPTNLSFEGK